MPPLPDEMLLIGRIVGPFGVRGQLRVAAVTDRPKHLQHVKRVFVGDTLKPYRLRQAFVHKPSIVVLALEGVGSRNAAETLREQDVYIRQSDALPLEEEEYYLHDLPGMRVQTLDGVDVGVVKGVIETGANEVLVVTRPEGGEVLVPMIKDVVKQLDIAGGTIMIEPMPGLLE
jgi:16S rRNA processing protein RimM